jgi:hypothetical protein
MGRISRSDRTDNNKRKRERVTWTTKVAVCDLMVTDIRISFEADEPERQRDGNTEELIAKIEQTKSE